MIIMNDFSLEEKQNLLKKLGKMKNVRIEKVHVHENRLAYVLFRCSIDLTRPIRTVRMRKQHVVQRNSSNNYNNRQLLVQTRNLVDPIV
jgi:hypothetical protein